MMMNRTTFFREAPMTDRRRFSRAVTCRLRALSALIGLLCQVGCTRQEPITEVVLPTKMTTAEQTAAGGGTGTVVGTGASSGASSGASTGASTGAAAGQAAGTALIESQASLASSAASAEAAVPAISPDHRPQPPATSAQQAGREDQAPWRDLFDGKSLSGWELTKFGGHGEVIVEDGQLIFEAGYPMTGITSTLQELPKSNYEIRLEAMRMAGSDFFCCLTMPVKDSFCSYVVGGWGGATVGISSIDFMDASENETMTIRGFKNKQWYRLRARVTDERIQAWIDDEQVVDVDIVGRKISTRAEVLSSRPLGLCTFDSQAAMRNIQIRSLE